MRDLHFISPLILLLVLSWTTTGVLAVDAAGKVVFATGEVSAIGADGRARYLIKGDQVFAAETVVTGEGKLQIQFSDGGYASLKAHTEYRLSEYVYRGAADGRERSFFDLIKGSVRFVTGVIGKANRKNFRIGTKTATIGIRGSSGLVVSCVAGGCSGKADGTYLTTYNGILTIRSGAFSTDVFPQETYFCDGASCVQINGDGAQTPAAEVLPDLDQGYRQGDQQIIEPGGHTHEHVTPDAGSPGYP